MDERAQGTRRYAPDSASRPTDRVVAILNALAENPQQPMGLSELAKGLGLSVATCHAIVTQLVTANYLTRKKETKRYCLGPRVVRVGRAAQNVLGPGNAAHDLLQKLSDKTKMMCTIRTKIE